MSSRLHPVKDNAVAGSLVPSEVGFDAIHGRIVEALSGLKFGSVEIQIHDSRIVRITRTESVRLITG